jgi:hypothetical protein
MAKQLRVWAVLFPVGLLAAAYVVFVGARLLSLNPPESAPAAQEFQYPTPLPCTPVPDPENPPLYPGAQDVAMVPAATAVWLGVSKTISFHTADSPQSVVAFYKDAMLRAGWSLGYQQSEAVKTPMIAQDIPTAGGPAPDLTTLARETPRVVYVQPEPGTVEVLAFSTLCGWGDHALELYIRVKAPAPGVTAVELEVH